MKKIIGLILSVITVFTLGVSTTGCSVVDKIESLYNGVIEDVDKLESAKPNESTKPNEGNEGNEGNEETSESSDIQEVSVNSVSYVYEGKEYKFLCEIDVIEGRTYTFELLARDKEGNKLDIGSNFDFRSMSISGKLMANKKVYSAGKVSSEEEVVVDLASGQVGGIPIYVSDFFTASIDGNILVVKVKKNASSFLYPINAVANQGTIYEYVGPYYDPRGGGHPNAVFGTIYVEVPGTEKYAGLTINL